MSVVGPRDIHPTTKTQSAFTYAVASHQHAEGLGASIENPAGDSSAKGKRVQRHLRYDGKTESMVELLWFTRMSVRGCLSFRRWRTRTYPEELCLGFEFRFSQFGDALSKTSRSDAFNPPAPAPARHIAPSKARLD